MEFRKKSIIVSDSFPILIHLIAIKGAFEKSDPKAVSGWGKKYVGETIQGKRKRILKLNKNKDLELDLTRFIQQKELVA